ncbi:MAG: TolC family protein [bacterium]
MSKFFVFFFLPPLVLGSSLEDFITLAIENNQELKIERLALNKQEFSFKKARKAEFYPEVSLSLSASEAKETVELKDEEGKEYKQTTKTKQKPTLEAITGISRPHPLGGKLKLNLKLSGVIDEKDKEKGELSLESEEPISLYQRKVIKEPLLDEKEDLLLSEISLNKKIEDLIYNVISSYCELQRLSSSIMVKENEFNDLKDTLEIAKAKLEKGIIPELDVFQISVSLKTCEIELSSLRREREEKWVRFLYLLGTSSARLEIKDCNWNERIKRLKELKIERRENNLELKIKNIEIERAKRALKEARAENAPIFVPSYTITIDEIKKQIAGCQVISPISGVVKKINVEKNTKVEIGSILLSLATTEGLVAKGSLKEANFFLIKPCQKTELYSESLGKRFKGVILKVTSASTKDQKEEQEGWEMVSLIENPQGLREGMELSCEVIIKENPKESLVIPPEALYEEDSVLVVEKGKIKKKKIEVGESTTDSIEVLSGVKEGEKIVIQYEEELKEGMRVKVR